MSSVAITGIGIYTSCGEDKENFFDNLINGKSGIKKVTAFSTKNCNCHIGAASKNQLKLLHNRPDTKGRMYEMAVKAVQEALSTNSYDAQECDIIVGACCSGVIELSEYMRGDYNPEIIKYIPIQSLGYYIANYFHIKGNVTTVSNACATGTMLLGIAKTLIESKKAKKVIVVATDQFSEFTFSGFHSMKALTSDAYSPLGNSDGIVLGEGAAALLIEDVNQISSKPIAYINGYGNYQDAFHITAPDDDGKALIHAIKTAISESGLTLNDIDYMNLHGTGTPKNDSLEKKIVKKLFYENGIPIPVSSIKGAIGHCLGAAGIIEAATCALALNHEILPPTIQHCDLINPEKEIECLYQHSLHKKVTNILSNSLAFGGNNAVVVISKEESKNELVQQKITKKGVFITGIDILTSISADKDDFLQFVKSPKNQEDWNHGKYKVIKNLNIEKHKLNPLNIRKYDRFSLLGLLGSLNAINDARLEINDENSYDTGILYGTYEGPFMAQTEFMKSIIENGVDASSGFWFPNTVFNAAAGHLSIKKGIKGYTTTFSSGNLSALNIISHAYELIATNLQKVVVGTCIDELTEAEENAYKAIGIKLESEEMHYPYQRKDNEITLGEGCVSLIFTSDCLQNDQNKECYAEVIGYHQGFAEADIDKKSLKMFEKLSETIKEAIKMANISINDIDAIVGFGSGNVEYDKLEMECYFNVWNEHLSDMDLYNLKHLTGECRSSSSALQVAMAALLLKENIEINDILQFDLNNFVIPIRVNMRKKERYHYIIAPMATAGGGVGTVVLKRV